jgi:phytol kinase
MALIFTALIILCLLVGNEVWFRNHKTHSELSRKFIHITVGSFVAFWPYFMSWNEIRLLSLAFLLVVGFSRYFKLFKAIHSVARPTWGEVYFAVAVGAISFITQTKWVYAVALLQMSLADGLAAVIGVKYGKASNYKVAGQTKSFAGTATFILVSFVILAVFNFYGPTAINLLTMAGLSIAAGIVENLGAFGLDNLLVPILIAIVLK